MKKSIRILAVVLCMAMVFSTMSFVSLAAGTTVTVTSPDGVVEPGDTFTLDVEIAGNTGFTNVEWNIVYDTTRLELTEMVTSKTISIPGFGDITTTPLGTAAANPNKDGTNKGYVAGAQTQSSTTNGWLFSLVFSVKSTATSGNAEVTIVSDKFNNVGQPVAATFVPATVVVEVPPVAATGVALDKETVELNIGATETLVATVAPNDATNKAVTWKSSDATIVSVDGNGKVTANKVGTATITVTTADGGFTDTCDVTVSCGAHTGGTANCMEKAQCSKCGASYGELADHAYGELIIQKDAVHTSTKLEAGMKAHY